MAAFKTDSIKLKVFADTGARNTQLTANGTSGELCNVDGSLQISTGSGWTAVDATSFSNTVNHAVWSGHVELASGVTTLSVVYYNTTAQGNTHELRIPPVAEYQDNAQVQVINGSPDDMHITKKAGSDADFNWASNGGSVAQIDIGHGQRALFLKTSAKWEVIVMAL